MQTDSSIRRMRLMAGMGAPAIATALMAEASQRVYEQAAAENPVPLHDPSVDKGQTEALQRLHCPSRHPDESLAEYRLRQKQSRMYGSMVR